ncbi:MAG: hypothetical protein KGV46_03475 [Pasteurella sp.]|nr:hypothetical protein [Pasteurella sp.]
MILKDLFGEYLTLKREEITSTQSNECYLLDRKLYAPLFTMTVEEVKKQLLDKNMLYIGAIKQDEFIIDAQSLTGAEQIVILAEGV